MEAKDRLEELIKSEEINSLDAAKQEGFIKGWDEALLLGKAEQLVSFGIWIDKNDIHLENGNITETVKEYLKNN